MRSVGEQVKIKLPRIKPGKEPTHTFDNVKKASLEVVKKPPKSK